MKIAFDIDEVLVSIRPSIARAGYPGAGTDEHIQKSMSTFNFSESFPGSREHWKQVIFDFLDSGAPYEIPPIKGAIEGLPAIAKKHTVVAITHRSKASEKATTEWIDKHFPDIFKEVHIAGFSNEQTETKGQWCARNNVDILIDDSYNNVLSANKEGLQGWLFGDYGWTNSVKDDQAIRVKSWDELLARLIP